MTVARVRFTKWFRGEQHDPVPEVADPPWADEPIDDTDVPELVDEVRRLRRENTILRRIAAYLADRT